MAAVHADEYSDVNQLLRAGRVAEAQAKVERHLAAKPRDPQMRFIHGVIQRDSGRLVDAINTFTKLTEDYPELPEPYNNLAVIYASQGLYEKASTALEMAIRTNPSYATAHENLGDIYARLASQAYSKALQLDSSSSTAQPKLALIRDLFASPDAALPGKNIPQAARPALVAVAPAPAKPVVAPTAPVAATPAAAVAAPAPAPAKTAPAPAKPAVETVAPASTSSPSPAAGTPAIADSAAAEAAVQAWAQAWASKNMEQYLASYAKDFDPPGQLSRSAWEEQRRVRIVGKSRITLKLLNLQVSVKDTRAVAKFLQDYQADTLAIQSLKTLELSKTGGRWLITKETSGR